MVKKAAIGIGSVVVLSGLVFGTSVWSYMRTVGTMAQEAAEDAIPVTLQIERAKDMIRNDLEPEINRLKKEVISLRVDIERKENTHARRADELADQRYAMMKRTEELESGKTTFTVSNASYSKADFEKDLDTRVNRYEIAESTFKHVGQVLAAKKKALAAAEKKIQAFISARTDVTLQIEQLEARVKAVEAEEAINQIQVDDSKLSRIQTLLTDLDADVSVREQVVDAEGQRLTDLIPVEDVETAPTNVVDRARALLGNESFEQVADND
jgi:hypothetical protein